MKNRILRIPCPQCEGGESQFFYTERAMICSYCNGMKEVNILDHFNTIGVSDERLENVKSFIDDPRFVEYLETRSKEYK